MTVSITKGKAYTTPSGAIFVVERIHTDFTRLTVRGYDDKGSRWLSWEISFQEFCRVLDARRMKGRKKLAPFEVGAGNDALPPSLRPGEDAAVCL
jgi:hypothetical protein